MHHIVQIMCAYRACGTTGRLRRGLPLHELVAAVRTRYGYDARLRNIWACTAHAMYRFAWNARLVKG